MPYVTPRLQAEQYTGANEAAIAAIIASFGSYWTPDPSYIGGLRWTGAENDNLTLPIGGYLVYNANGVNDALTQEAYEAYYHEIT